MKKLFSLNLLIALAVVFASCGTNNNVVNNRLISKRKYNKGFHINRKGNMKSSKIEQEESIAFEDVKKSKHSTEVKQTAPERSKHKPSNEGFEQYNETASSTIEVEENTRRNTSNRTETSDSFEPFSKESTLDNLTLETDEQEQDSKSERKTNEKKKHKKSSSNNDAMFVLIVIVTILLPPLGVAIYTNIDWMKVLICLLLTILFFLPGLIYGLLVVFDVI